VPGAAVEVAGLRRAYGETRAVDGVDLEVAHGECVAVLGPNGAGKTTTVEILEGYRRRDGGDVRVLGVDPATGDRAWRARLGIVLQSNDERLEVTVREMVAQFARYFPRPRDPDELIELVGLGAKAGTRARALSGGQRRRLDVALGIVGRPELVFLDEPTTGFDPEARRGFWDLVDSLRAEGTTVLLTTHYLEEAERLADRVVVVNAGRVVAEGPPATLGGRAARQVVVRWREDGRAREERTDAPTALVSRLAASFGGEVPGLQVVRPTLEDVYLALVGPAGGQES
jgi:ABC-2 type transport system ATP-binding protein